MEAEVDAMEQADEWSGEAPSLESLRDMRLTALLNDVMDELGQVKAAQELGVDRKTLWRCRTTGQLTARLSDALERLLLSKDLSEAMRHGKRIEGLAERVSALEEELRGRIENGVGKVKALREEHARAMRHVERRLVALESGRRGSEPPSPTAPEPDSKRRYVPPRTYPQLVTRDAEEGEERVYGDAAPVIVEWRQARDVFQGAAKTGTTLEMKEAQERMLELEIAIIERHELTLPPASYPWDKFDRRDELWERNRDLNRVRVERNRALLRMWLRRVLTCGIWRS